MTRKTSVDIAKGIGISLVVTGHLIDYFGADLQGVYTYIYLFHIPLFFFLSGMFFQEKESFGECLKKKFFRLYIPYLLANIFFFAVEMIRARILGDSYDGNMTWSYLTDAVLGLWPVLSMLSRPTWFILILFRVFIIYKLLQLVFKGNKHLMLAVCVTAGVIGAYFPVQRYMIGQTLAALPFFSLGHICTAEIVDNQKVFSIPKSILLGLASAIALYFISLHQQTNIAVNCYDKVPLYFIGAILGVMMILWLSIILEKWTPASKSLSFVGRYTLPVLIWHVFVIKVFFKGVETVFGISGGAVLYVIAFLTGLLLPIGFSMCYRKVKSKK